MSTTATVYFNDNNMQHCTRNKHHATPIQSNEVEAVSDTRPSFITLCRSQIILHVKVNNTE